MKARYTRVAAVALKAKRGTTPERIAEVSLGLEQLARKTRKLAELFHNTDADGPEHRKYAKLLNEATALAWSIGLILKESPLGYLTIEGVGAYG